MQQSSRPEAIEIILENPTGFFYAGDRVKGTVVLVTVESLHVQSIYLYAKGSSWCHWVNKNSDKIYEDSQTYLDKRYTLLHKPTQLARGAYKYNFHFTLPFNGPSTYENDWGRVCYMCEARVIPHIRDMPLQPSGKRGTMAATVLQATLGGDMREITCQKEVTVVAVVNMFSYPNALRPMCLEDMVEFTWCGFSRGNVYTELTIPSHAFMNRKEVRISGFIENNSKRRIKYVRLMILQRVTFTAVSRYENVRETREVTRVVAQAGRDDVFPNTKERIFEQLLRLNNVIPSQSSRNCQVRYFFRLEGHPSLELEVPLIIVTRCV